LINDLKVYCKFKPSGCESEIPIQDFTFHVSACLFAPSHCIHSSLGCKWTGMFMFVCLFVCLFCNRNIESIINKNKHEEKQTSMNKKQTNMNKKIGTRNTLSDHLKQCTFEEMKDYIKFSQETIAALKTKVEVKN